MKIFDLHADIGYHILNEKNKNHLSVFRDHHLPKLKKGEFVGVGMVSFFEGKENLKRAYAMIDFLHDQIQENSDLVSAYTGGVLIEDKINALMTIEGMCFIEDEVISHLNYFYQKGVRIASLTWNEENNLATGAKSNPNRGITQLGKEAIQHMNDIGMIIDVSHLNEKSFWEVLEISKKPVIATHSNSRHYANVDRNLTTQQLKALIANKGLIGLNAVRYFVEDDESKQDVAHLAKQARYISDCGGIDCIAIGFDFMDYLDGPYGRNSMAQNIQSANEAQNFIYALENENFNAIEIEKITSLNVLDFLNKHLK